MHMKEVSTDQRHITFIVGLWPLMTNLLERDLQRPKTWFHFPILHSLHFSEKKEGRFNGIISPKHLWDLSKNTDLWMIEFHDQLRCAWHPLKTIFWILITSFQKENFQVETISVLVLQWHPLRLAMILKHCSLKMQMKRQLYWARAVFDWPDRCKPTEHHLLCELNSYVAAFTSINATHRDISCPGYSTKAWIRKSAHGKRSLSFQVPTW